MLRKQINDTLAKIEALPLPPKVVDHIEKELQKEFEEFIARRLTHAYVARSVALAYGVPAPRQSAAKESTEPQ